MTGPKLVATSAKNIWAVAAIVTTMLVVAGCELPGAERAAEPPALTRADSLLATKPPPATVATAVGQPRMSVLRLPLLLLRLREQR